MPHGSNSAMLKSEIGRNSDFRFLLHGDPECKTEIGKSETIELEILISIGRGHLFHCMCSDATRKQQCNAAFDFCFPLHLLCCRMGIQSAKPKSKIKNHEIENSDFRRERPLVLLHVLWCSMRVIVQRWNRKKFWFTLSTACPLPLHKDQKCKLKLKIKKHEIENFDFRKERPLISLHVLLCLMEAIVQCCCICFVAAWGSRVQYRNQKSGSMKLEIPISIGRGHLFRCMCSNAARDQQCNVASLFATSVLLPHGNPKCKIEIENREPWNHKFWFSQGEATCFITCALMMHGSNSTMLKSKIGRNSHFRFPLHELCCCMGIKSAKLKLEIRNHENWKL